jgi:glycosyltransferase involved in cell wall biosynthesis
MMRVNVARPIMAAQSNRSVSIVIPCRNEAGNIEDAVKRIPQLGTHTEIIFGDDKSTDGTPDIVREMMKKYPEKNIRLVDSPGICKAMNVWTCFDAAQNDVLMILDADLTVIPEELPYFFEAMAQRHGEFINGSRLVYPMHNEAMPFFNVIGNKFFSLAFTYILDTPIKDTLCGTKVLLRSDYEKIKKLRGTWGINDRWGDYELIFGAAKQHLKIVDLPVHYYERTYGETKMTGRIKNGLIMLKMCRAALMKIKFH